MTIPNPPPPPPAPTALTSATLFHTSLPWPSLKRIAARAPAPKPKTKPKPNSRPSSSRARPAAFSTPADDLTLVYCLLDSDPVRVTAKATHMYQAIASVPNIDQAVLDECLLYFATPSTQAYGKLRKAMPDVDLSQWLLPYLLVFQSESGTPVTTEGVAAAQRDPTVCVASWMRGPAEKVTNRSPLGGRMSWAELVGGSKSDAARLCPIVIVIAVGQEPHGSASAEAVNCIMHFFAAAPAAAAQVSLIAIPVGDNVHEWESALAGRSTKLGAHVHGFMAVAQALGMNVPTAKILGYEMRVFLRETGVIVPAFKAFMAIVEQEMDADEWVEAVIGNKFLQ